MARIRLHRYEPLPAPVAPAISRCVPRGSGFSCRADPLDLGRVQHGLVGEPARNHVGVAAANAAASFGSPRPTRPGARMPLALRE